MKILAIEFEHEGADWQNAQAILNHEAEAVYRHYLLGQLREIFFNENKQAVLILEMDNKNEAKQLLDQLPLVQQGLIRFEIMELHPYTGYSRLMK